MKLKEIIIDGFKSYASRTVISGFDPAFTAITGLNGSGKSNILDSICFVLGISNLSQVRASSLSELVYKSGQAGVTRATVSLVFDNDDRRTSPVGYEDFGEITVTRQIVIAGKSKYLINGHVAPPTRVHNFFQVIGLNVNNPHFLVMQGRITKVINMKPAEILSLIEESAGVKMYETKKDAAIKTIQKKASKVNEIDALLHDKINPTLQRLESERKHYMAWNKNRSDMEVLQRSLIAGQYQLASSDMRGTERQREVIQEKLAAVEATIADVEIQREQLSAKMKGFGSTSGVNEELEDQVEQLDRTVTKLQSSHDTQKAVLEGEQKALQALVREIDELSKAAKDKESELEASVAAVKAAEFHVYSSRLHKSATRNSPARALQREIRARIPESTFFILKERT
jgi:structural maintenance of chromosome 2